jgi:tetratricopeptide (TPR) repeat protein
MRSSAVTRLSTGSQDASASKAGTFIGIAALALAAGGLLWYMQNSKVSGAPSDPKPGSTAVASPSVDALTEDQQDAQSLPIKEDPKIAELALLLSANASSKNARVKAIRQALEKRISLVDDEGILGRNSMTPADCAARLLSGKEPLKLNALEAGFLALHLIQSLGIEASAVTQPSTPSTAIVLRQRNLLIRYSGDGGKFHQFALYQEQDNPNNAAVSVQKASYEPAMLNALSAFHALEIHALEKAARLVADALALAPNDASLRFMHGQVAILRGEVDAGLQEMQAAVEKNEDASGRYQLAVAFLRSEQFFKAHQALRRAVSIDPNYAQAWSALAQVTLNRLQTASEIQKQGILSELDKIEASLAKIGPAATGLIELRVHRLVVNGRLDEATQLLNKALVTHPKRVPLHMLMADLAQRRGDKGLMIKHLQAAAAADPNDAEALVALSEVLESEGKTEEAIKALESAVLRAPYEPDLLAQLAAGYQEHGDTGRAKATAQKLLERFPDHLGGPAVLAQLAALSGDHKQAEAVLLKALKKHKREPSLYVMLYFTYMSSGAKEKAARVADELAKIEPDGRMRIAQQLLQSGQVELAVELMEVENAADPTRIEVVITLAQLLFVSNQADKVRALKSRTAELIEDRAAFEQLFDEAMSEMKRQLKESGPSTQ